MFRLANMKMTNIKAVKNVYEFIGEKVCEGFVTVYRNGNDDLMLIDYTNKEICYSVDTHTGCVTVFEKFR